MKVIKEKICHDDYKIKKNCCRDMKVLRKVCYIPINEDYIKVEIRGYKNVSFKYCPFCGEKIEAEKEM